MIFASGFKADAITSARAAARSLYLNIVEMGNAIVISDAEYTS
jgi:hypothetical protein